MEEYLSPCKRSELGGSKFNWRKKSKYTRIWCQLSQDWLNSWSFIKPEPKTIQKKVCNFGCQSCFCRLNFSSKTANLHVNCFNWKITQALSRTCHQIVRSFWQPLRHRRKPYMVRTSSTVGKRAKRMPGTTVETTPNSPHSQGVWNLPHKFHLYLIKLSYYDRLKSW